jgi:undecaprenyl-diphosphatase
MVRWDRQLESWVAGHRVGVLNPVFEALTYIGTSGAVWLAIGLAVALRSRRWQVLLWVAAADGAAQLSTSLIKLAVPRHRPRVHTLVSEPHTHSFPSGHAASSFACAIVLASYAPRLRVLLWVLAALIAFSRVYVGVHYPLDVLAGAIIGILLGLAILEIRNSPLRARRPRPRR